MAHQLQAYNHLLLGSFTWIKFRPAIEDDVITTQFSLFSFLPPHATNLLLISFCHLTRSLSFCSSIKNEIRNRFHFRFLRYISKSKMKEQKLYLTVWIAWTTLLRPAFCDATVQTPQPSETPTTTDGLYTNLDPVMTTIILVLIAIFFFISLFSVYIRHFSNTTSAAAAADGNDNDLPSRAAAGKQLGLNPAVIETFPILSYSSVKKHKIGREILECAVCLSEFEDGETLRLLPKCDHVFHPECIDAWLACHVTCPVCRAKLTPEESIESAELTRSDPSSDQVAIEINDEEEEESISHRHHVTVESATTSHVTPKSNKSPRLKFPRSHSTGHSILQNGVYNIERFTLRLPDEVRKQILISRKLNRTVSLNVVLSRECSLRKCGGGGGEGSSGGGRSNVDRQDRWGFSMTPPFVYRIRSVECEGLC